MDTKRNEGIEFSSASNQRHSKNVCLILKYVGLYTHRILHGNL